MALWCNGRLLLRVSPVGLLRLDTSTLPERLHHRRHRPLCPSLCPTPWDTTTKTFLCPVSTMVGVFLGRECGLSGHMLGDGWVWRGPMASGGWQQRWLWRRGKKQRGNLPVSATCLCSITSISKEGFNPQLTALQPQVCSLFLIRTKRFRWHVVLCTVILDWECV